jgi:hypothetical protein
MMLPPIMSVCTIQSRPLPQLTVDCFMSVSGTTHSIRVLSISSINLLGKNRLPVTTPGVPKITKWPFSFLKLPLGLIPEDLDIIPFSIWKRTIVRNNVTSSNAS